MRYCFILSGLFLLISCNTFVKRTNTNVVQVTQGEKDTIIALFEQWKQDQVADGNWVSEENCNPEWMLAQYEREDFEELNIPMLGFETEKEGYLYSFGDINLDGKPDGMVSFAPRQCDGGNGLMWLVTNVLLISDSSSYQITDTVDFNVFKNADFNYSGFYSIDSISGRRVYGTYIQFLEDDGHCCPSIQEQVIFDYPKRKLIYRENHSL